MADRRLLTPAEVEAALATLPAWQGDTGGISRTVRCASFTAAADLVRRIAPLADELDHHPDVDLRWRDVTFALSTHSEGGVTALDVELARAIDAAV